MAREWASSAYTRDEAGLTTDEKIASLFQPDTLLTAQYFDNLRRKSLLEPEKRLMLAILEDAISRYQENMFSQDKRGKRHFREVEEWIADADSDWIFSFENVCESLGLNPAYVRKGLLRWKEKGRQMLSHRETWEGKELAV
ncbi:MAG TPA: hypothetical protein VGW77_15910 [Candidatus Binatia bacterium]|jgi:hypothetical protein|nr:hypothetical protein [Candidatus Binatia bacterium]